jgi:hypothetical protein
MKFEEILPLLREGKKAKTQDDRVSGSFWMLGYSEKDKVYSLLKFYHDEDFGICPGDRYSYGPRLPLYIADESWEIME